MSQLIRWLRWVGLIEGVSFLVLLLVAMPLKYGAGKPQMVEIVGMAHGLLFVLLLLFVAVAYARGLPGKLAGWCVVGAVIPTGPFWVDSKLKAFAASIGETRP